MPRTEAQNEEIRQATRRAIVESAMTLFARNGFANTTVRQIARQAGLSTGLMYHYFDSKEALLEAVFETCMAVITRAFAQAYEGAQPEERLAAVLGTIFSMLQTDAGFWGLFCMLRTQPAIMAVLGDSFRLWTGRLRQLFTSELRDLGSADPEMDALLLYSLVEGTIQQYLLDPAGYPLAQVGERIVTDFAHKRMTGESNEPLSS